LQCIIRCCPEAGSEEGLAIRKEANAASTCVPRRLISQNFSSILSPPSHFHLSLFGGIYCPGPAGQFGVQASAVVAKDLPPVLRSTEMCFPFLMIQFGHNFVQQKTGSFSSFLTAHPRKKERYGPRLLYPAEAPDNLLSP
jgi:hypothetical protein